MFPDNSLYIIHANHNRKGESENDGKALLKTRKIDIALNIEVFETI